MSRAREAGQQLAASYYGFDGFPEFMFVFFFFGPFSEARLTGSFREVHWGCLTSVPPPGPGNLPGKVKRSDETDVRKTPA